MSAPKKLSRRTVLRLGAVSASSLALAGCDQFDFLGQSDNSVRDVLETANSLTYRVQRLLLGQHALAPEYPESAVRQPMRPNGSTNPQNPDYLALRANNFADYKLSVTGMVDNPATYSLAELRAMTQRTQITRHDCVEGWSCIAKWTGTPLSGLLDRAGVKPEARFVVFHCFDNMGNAQSPEPYYESCDLIDAHHPQTILAYGLNGQDLPVSNGAPIRVRVERALGYKQPKYVHTIELVESFAHVGGGHGGYWEDHGYDWYAGI
jgi:DMSO/TMAO reductase YedYZ molybdopterin-dependent catalytic subunit